MKCDFECLCLYLRNGLDEKKKIAVIDHLHRCEICREAVLTMLQEGDEPSAHTLSVIADLEAVRWQDTDSVGRQESTSKKTLV